MVPPVIKLFLYVERKFRELWGKNYKKFGAF